MLKGRLWICLECNQCRITSSSGRWRRECCVSSLQPHSELGGEGTTIQMEQWDHAMAQEQRFSVGTIQGVPLLASLGMFSTSGRFRRAGGSFLPRHYHTWHPDCSPCAYSPGTWQRKWGSRRTWSRQDNTRLQTRSTPMPFLVLLPIQPQIHWYKLHLTSVFSHSHSSIQNGQCCIALSQQKKWAPTPTENQRYVSPLLLQSWTYTCKQTYN